MFPIVILLLVVILLLSVSFSSALLVVPKKKNYVNMMRRMMMMMNQNNDNDIIKNDSGKKAAATASATITGLYRYAVKGLNGDSLDRVIISKPYDTFPDDRRFALLYEHTKNDADKWYSKNNKNNNNNTNNSNQQQQQPAEWLHKENFLCTFTNPELMATLDTNYYCCTSSSQPSQEVQLLLPTSNDHHRQQEESSYIHQQQKRLLEIKDRATGNLLWGPQDLSTETGRLSLGDFFSQYQQQQQQSNNNNKNHPKVVRCITADPQSVQQTFQFGNTSSNWKQRNDTRCIHIINANTVQQIAERCNIPVLHPIRFRPNIIVGGKEEDNTNGGGGGNGGWEPWSEFDWIGKRLQVTTKSSLPFTTPMTLRIISKTVRCNGVSIDPTMEYRHSRHPTKLDIPKLLTQHFPEHGPYLGVYAIIETAGALNVGDQISVIDE